MIKISHKYLLGLFDAIATGQMQVAVENGIEPTDENIYQTGLAIGFVGLSFALKEGNASKEDLMKDISDTLDKFLAGEKFVEAPDQMNLDLLLGRDKKDSN